MRTKLGQLTGVVICLVGILSQEAFASKTKRKEVLAVCSGLSESELPVVAVADFLVKADVSSQVGHGMAAMLANALQGTGCFQVVERERLGDVFAEQSLGQTGAVVEANAVATGKLAGAQFQVLGEITAFTETASGGKIGGAFRFLRKFSGKGKLGGIPDAVAGSAETRVAQVNFSIRIVDAASGRLVESGEWETKRSNVSLDASALPGGWGQGLQSIGAAGFKSQAIADAVSDGIIEASADLAHSAHAKMVARIRAAQNETHPVTQHDAGAVDSASAKAGSAASPGVAAAAPDSGVDTVRVSPSAPETVVYLVVKNTTFGRTTDLQKLIEKTKDVTAVSKESFKDGEARLAVRTCRNAGAIADVVQNAATALRLKVTSFDKDTVQVVTR